MGTLVQPLVLIKHSKHTVAITSASTEVGWDILRNTTGTISVKLSVRPLTSYSLYISASLFREDVHIYAFPEKLKQGMQSLKRQLDVGHSQIPSRWIVPASITSC